MRNLGGAYGCVELEAAAAGVTVSEQECVRWILCAGASGV